MTLLDIHDFAQRYEQATDQLLNSDISDRNKELILAYRDACLLHQVCGKVRLIRVFIILPLLARRLDKDFDQISKADVQRLVASLLDLPLKPSTVSTYKSVLKRFLSFVLRPDEFPHLDSMPNEIAWMRTHVRKRDEPRLQRKDLLTPNDVEQLIRACDNARDRAFIATLWEAGARISEVGNLQLAHLTKHEHGFSLDMTGKTGHRNVLVISAAPYLSQWLSVHAQRDNPDAPLWVYRQHSEKSRNLAYAGLCKILRQALARTGSKKRVYPHLFRHSRCTYVLATGIMNEQQAKAYFGWTPDSGMLATYCHLIDQDANDAILRENNLATTQERPTAFRPTSCPNCQELNTPSNKYCTRCTSTLNPPTAYNALPVQDQNDTVVLRLVEILVKKGLLNDATDEIHKARLGPTLKTLAAK